MASHPAPIFLEFIGVYTDGENLDVMLDVRRVIYARPHPTDQHQTLLTLDVHPESSAPDLLAVIEPYLSVKRRIRKALELHR